MAVRQIKSAKKLERHFKGVANHRRIEILMLVARRPEIIQEDIIGELKGNQKTIREHIRRLYHAGLIDKTYAGRGVQHTLTPYGETFVSFIKSFTTSGTK